LNGPWLDRLIENPTPNAPELHFRQGLLHGDIQGLYYDLGDMYTLTPKIKKDIEFQKVLNVKLKPVKFSMFGT
jgi:hypothetical protein